jgi:hypothetical protein
MEADCALDTSNNLKFEHHFLTSELTRPSVRNYRDTLLITKTLLPQPRGAQV